MTKYKKVIILFIVVMLLFVSIGTVAVTFQGDWQTMSFSVTTNATTNVKETTALLHGYLSDDGGGCNVKFQYGTTTGYGSSTTNQSKRSGDEFNAGIASLSPFNVYNKIYDTFPDNVVDVFDLSKLWRYRTV